jgi:hypothetical protein
VECTRAIAGRAYGPSVGALGQYAAAQAGGVSNATAGEGDGRGDAEAYGRALYPQPPLGSVSSVSARAGGDSSVAACTSAALSTPMAGDGLRGRFKSP